MSCKCFWISLKNSSLYLCLYFILGVVGSFWFRLGCWSFLHLLWTSPSWEYYSFVWGMIHSEKAASPSVDDPDDLVYARLFFMPRMFKFCVYLQCLYSPIYYSHSEGKLTLLSFKLVYFICVAGSDEGARNSRTTDLEMPDGRVYLSCWGFSHRPLDYLYCGTRRGCCILRWQIFTGTELEVTGGESQNF